MSLPDPEPPFWPRGADESRVRECNCAHCGALVDALEDWRDGVAPDGEHAALESFGGLEA